MEDGPICRCAALIQFVIERSEVWASYYNSVIAIEEY